VVLCKPENRRAQRLAKVWKRREAEQRGGIVRKVCAYDSKEARNRIRIKLKRSNPSGRPAAPASHCNQAVFGTSVNVPHLSGSPASVRGCAGLPFWAVCLG